MRVFTEDPAKKEAPKGIPIRALLDVMDRIPEKKFGRGPSRRLRKLVLLGLAASADPDGSNAFPSLNTLARRSLATERSVRRAIEWWAARGIISVEYKAGRNGTNLYTIHFERALQERKRTRKTHGLDVDTGFPGQGRPGPDLDTGGPGDADNAIGGGGHFEDVPGHSEPLGGHQVSANRPSDRAFRPSEFNRPQPSITSNNEHASSLSIEVAPANGNQINASSLTPTPPAQVVIAADDRTAFLTEQARLFRENGVSTRSTPRHLEDSWQTAQREGVANYLTGLQLWLEEAAEDELVISTESPITGRRMTQEHSWPLKAFLDGQSALACIDQARGLIERWGISGPVAVFLHGNCMERQLRLTPEQAARLAAVLRTDAGEAQGAYEDMNRDRAFFDDPAGAIERWRVELEENRKKMIAEEQAAKEPPA